MPSLQREPEHDGGDVAGGSAAATGFAATERLAALRKHNVATADPKLLRVLRPYCDATAKERNVKSRTLRSAVRPRWRNCCPTAKPKLKTWRRRWPSACAPSREDWMMKAGRTATSSTKCGRASPLNISTIRGCRSGRLRGCSATRDRPRSIMLSSVGPGDRLRQPGGNLSRFREVACC